MGKKKVLKEDEGKLLKETEAIETAAAETSAKSVGKKLDKGRVYVKASYNNTLITVTDDKGDMIAWSSAGALGFKGPKKATPFASSKVVGTLIEKLKKTGLTNLVVYLNGIGGGRDSALRTFANQGFNILEVHDVTPIPHNGPKPKKPRRV